MRKFAAIACLLLVFLGIIFRGAWDNWSQIFIFYLSVILFLWYLVYIFARGQGINFRLLWGWLLFFFCQYFLLNFSQQKYISSQIVLNYFTATVILILASSADYSFIFQKSFPLPFFFLIYLFLFIGYFTLPKPNFLAAYLVIFSAGLLSLFRDEEQYLMRIIFLAVNLLILFFLRSYSSLLAIGLLLLYQLLIARRRIIAVSPVIVDVLFFGAIVILAVLLVRKISRPDAINRLMWWKNAWAMFQHYPLTGVGAGLFERYFVNFHLDGLGTIFVHNYFLELLAETGLISFSIFFIWLLILFWELPSARPFIFATAVFSVFDYGLTISGIQWAFMFVLGMHIATVTDKRKNLLSGLLFSIVFLVILANVLPWGGRNFLCDRYLARANYCFTRRQSPPCRSQKFCCLKAENYLQRASNLAPDDSRIFTMRAMCLQIAGKYSRGKERQWFWTRALKNQQQACVYEGNLSSNWYYLYQLSLLTRNRKLTKLASRRCLQLAPASNPLIKH